MVLRMSELNENISIPSRFTASSAAALLAECDASGLSVAAFARRRGVPDKTLYYWRRRLREDSAHASLARVEVMPESPEPSSDAMFITGAQGLSVELR